MAVWALGRRMPQPAWPWWGGVGEKHLWAEGCVLEWSAWGSWWPEEEYRAAPNGLGPNSWLDDVPFSKRERPERSSFWVKSRASFWQVQVTLLLEMLGCEEAQSLEVESGAEGFGERACRPSAEGQRGPRSPLQAHRCGGPSRRAGGQRAMQTQE